MLLSYRGYLGEIESGEKTKSHIFFMLKKKCHIFFMYFCFECAMSVSALAIFMSQLSEAVALRYSDRHLLCLLRCAGVIVLRCSLCFAVLCCLRGTDVQ